MLFCEVFVVHILAMFGLDLDPVWPGAYLTLISILFGLVTTLPCTCNFLKKLHESGTIGRKPGSGMQQTIIDDTINEWRALWISAVA